MTWIVDTCVMIDVLDNDPEFGLSSAQCLSDHLEDGLGVCPVSIVELAPTFNGSMDREREFFQLCGIDDSLSFLWRMSLPRTRVGTPM